MPDRNLNETPGPDRLLFVRDGLSYSFQAINPLDGTLSDDAAAQRKKDNDARTAVRTLRIGNHLFFLMRGQEGTSEGTMERYEIKGDLLLEYRLDNGAGVDFLETMKSFKFFPKSPTTPITGT